MTWQNIMVCVCGGGVFLFVVIFVGGGHRLRPTAMYEQLLLFSAVICNTEINC